MAVKFKTLREYLFQKGKVFHIPNYQRGYKWAVRYKEGELTSIENLYKNLYDAFISFKKGNRAGRYFLQGVTISHDGNNIILIDGQQRTTSLFLMLRCLAPNKIKDISIDYDIREQSKEYIEKLKDPCFNFKDGDSDGQKNQDIHFFIEAIEQINKKIRDIDVDKDDFVNYILDCVSILYIEIDKDKATKTFTMMNGNKATMLQEELVKAELLRKISSLDNKHFNSQDYSISLNGVTQLIKEIVAREWETNSLRSKYAREWDKWLYWWNKKDVQVFFQTNGKPMGLLLLYYLRSKQKDELKFNFKAFCSSFIEENINEINNTKICFKGLRDFQKSFEDIYNNPTIYNYLGMSLIDKKPDSRFDVINFFIQNKSEVSKLEDYAKWSLVGATHREIVESDKLKEDEQTKEGRAKDVLLYLSENIVYHSYDNWAFKQLLRLNVCEDINHQRKFDFSIWQNKSLEHIYPKSKVYHESEEGVLLTGANEKLEEEKIDTYLNRKDFKENGSEHCIGNLVLLVGRDNSEFGNKTFFEKKNRFFDIQTPFESRHLLHSISVFAKSDWRIEEIQNNKKQFIETFEKYYGIK